MKIFSEKKFEKYIEFMKMLSYDIEKLGKEE